MSRNELVDIAGQVRARTERAIQFFDGDHTVWLPLSQIEVNDDGTVTMPEWLAQEKELI